MGPLSVDEVSIPWLQWGRDLVIAEIRRRSVILLLDRPASMGPRSGDRGNSAGMLRARAVISASMGPRSGDRGNDRVQVDAGRIALASMGPRSGDRGNPHRSAPLKSAQVASMGPRSGDRGNEET